MPRRTVDRVILAAMLGLIVLGGYGAWRFVDWSRGPDATAQVQTWFDARADGSVAVESCEYQELDSEYDFHNCVIHTSDAEILARYGVTRPSAEISVCFSVPRAAVLGYRSDRDPRPENEQGLGGDCLGRT